MNTNFLKGLLLLAGLLSWAPMQAQPSYELGLLPAFNLNKRLNENWKLNLKTESRLLFVADAFSETPDRGWEYVLTDLSMLVSRNVGLNNALAAGYLLRFRDNNFQHRLVQQFTIVPVFNRFRLAHRIAADQTFDEASPTQYRFRYRIAAEIALNGSTVDPGEFYFKVNQEQLHSFSGADYDLEFRLVPVLGYDITDNNKVEAGLNYRIDSFLKSAGRNILYTTISWYRAL